MCVILVACLLKTNEAKVGLNYSDHHYQQQANILLNLFYSIAEWLAKFSQI